jgi:hypothetical protein
MTWMNGPEAHYGRMILRRKRDITAISSHVAVCPVTCRLVESALITCAR